MSDFEDDFLAKPKSPPPKDDFLTNPDSPTLKDDMLDRPIPEFLFPVFLFVIPELGPYDPEVDGENYWQAKSFDERTFVRTPERKYEPVVFSRELLSDPEFLEFFGVYETRKKQPPGEKMTWAELHSRITPYTDVKDVMGEDIPFPKDPPVVTGQRRLLTPEEAADIMKRYDETVAPDYDMFMSKMQEAADETGETGESVLLKTWSKVPTPPRSPRVGPAMQRSTLNVAFLQPPPFPAPPPPPSPPPAPPPPSTNVTILQPKKKPRTMQPLPPASTSDDFSDIVFPTPKKQAPPPLPKPAGVLGQVPLVQKKPIAVQGVAATPSSADILVDEKKSAPPGALAHIPQEVLHILDMDHAFNSGYSRDVREIFMRFNNDVEKKKVTGTTLYGGPQQVTVDYAAIYTLYAHECNMSSSTMLDVMIINAWAFMLKNWSSVAGLARSVGTGQFLTAVPLTVIPTFTWDYINIHPREKCAAIERGNDLRPNTCLVPWFTGNHFRLFAFDQTVGERSRVYLFDSLPTQTSIEAMQRRWVEYFAPRIVFSKSDFGLTPGTQGTLSFSEQGHFEFVVMTPPFSAPADVRDRPEYAQINGNDCGVFCCYYMSLIAQFGLRGLKLAGLGNLRGMLKHFWQHMVYCFGRNTYVDLTPGFPLTDDEKLAVDIVNPFNVDIAPPAKKEEDVREFDPLLDVDPFADLLSPKEKPTPPPAKKQQPSISQDVDMSPVEFSEPSSIPSPPIPSPDPPSLPLPPRRPLPPRKPIPPWYRGPPQKPLPTPPKVVTTPTKPSAIKRPFGPMRTKRRERGPFSEQRKELLGQMMDEAKKAYAEKQLGPGLPAAIILK